MRSNSYGQNRLYKLSGLLDVNGLGKLKIAAVGAPFAGLINFPGDILLSLPGKI